jgi:predicted ATP-binding protein involved in virulence
MISRHEFPYLQSLVIIDAYAVKNLTVPVFQADEEFKHLILTGRNGSGKTTVLRSLFNELVGNPKPAKMRNMLDSMAEQVGEKNISSTALPQVRRELSQVEPFFSNLLRIRTTETADRTTAVISFFQVSRNTQMADVKSVTTIQKIGEEVSKINSKEQASELFKQYLVNRRVLQAFDILEGKEEDVRKQEKFFVDLENALRYVLHDSNLKLEFARNEYEFYLAFSDKRRITFNQLAAGYSAFLSILTDLFMRTDLLRKQANDYTYDPCGFVLIDEPETHLHLEMQYQILPLLISLFPNLQFIVATHSPAVASSIKNATVFDLSTGKVMGDQAAGSSYSELMQTHFGVENEYSNVADAIIARINELAQLPDKVEARRQLQALLISEGRYMSPALRLEVEAQLIGLEEVEE